MNLTKLSTLVMISGTLIGSTGCGKPPADLMAMKMELNALKQELSYLREQTEDLDPRVRNAEQMAMQVFDEREAPLALDCAGHRPGVVQTRLAPITAVCDGFVSTKDGLRLSVKLGNPTSARLDGVRLTLYSGEGAVHGRTESRTYVETTTSLPPGEWRTVHLEIPAGPVNIKELALRAQINSIALAQR